MNRLFVLAGVLALGTLVVGLEHGASAQGKKKAPTLKQVMQASFGGKSNFNSRVRAAIKEGDWDAAAKEAKGFSACVKNLPNCKPPMGEQDDFKKMADTLVKTVSTLEDGIAAKDKQKAGGALGKIGGSCKSCHDDHRPKPKKRK